MIEPVASFLQHLPCPLSAPLPERPRACRYSTSVGCAGSFLFSNLIRLIASGAFEPMPFVMWTALVAALLAGITPAWLSGAGKTGAKVNASLATAKGFASASFEVRTVFVKFSHLPFQFGVFSDKFVFGIATAFRRNPCLLF